MSDLDYAIPENVVTVSEDESCIVQVATMLNSGDAILYARSCRRHGAEATIKDDLSVLVVWAKDFDGKIGPKYS